MANTVKSGQELDINDFMDVVTSYKCKFCSFTSPDIPGLANHVRSTHLKSENSTVNLVQRDSEAATLANVAQSLLMVQESGGPHGNNECPTDLRGNGARQTEGTEADGIVQQGSRVNSGVQQVAAGQSLLLVPNEAPSHDNASTQMEPGMVVSETDTLNQVEQVEVSVEPGDEEHGVVETTPDNGQSQAASSREVFVCGQCNLGFISIEGCKDHMIRDHGLSIPQSQEVTTESLTKPNCVDASTQVIRKKPGRKRKPKFENVPKSPAQKEEEQHEEEHNYNINAEVSGKRRIRIPKALQEDYYLGKRKRGTYRQRRNLAADYNYRCSRPGCMAKFKTQSVLEYHLSCHYSGDDPNAKPFCCVECLLPYDNWRLLRMHLWRHHQIDTDLFQCETCEFRADSVHKLMIHSEIHSDDRPYVCDTCGKGFKQMCQLKNHVIIHADRSYNPRNWYSNRDCDICHRSFANVKSLKKHIDAIHNKIKPFVCAFCNHTTARKAMMELHIRTHTGEKPYKCDSCTYVTGDHNSLRRHKMRHTGEKPYKCQYCTYSCIQAISLKTHMKNKHPGQEGIFCCDICQYRTVNKVHYLHHMEDHKNGLIPAENETTVSTTQDQLPTDDQVHIEAIQVAETPGQSGGKAPSQVQTEQSQTVNMVNLGNYDGSVYGDINAAQLLYSALNAISQNAQEQQAQTNVKDATVPSSVSSVSQDGITTHTITFHLPPPQDGEGDAEVAGSTEGQVLYVQPAEGTSGAQPQPVTQVVGENSINIVYNPMQGGFQTASGMAGVQTVQMIQTEDQAVMETTNDSQLSKAVTQAQATGDALAIAAASASVDISGGDHSQYS